MNLQDLIMPFIMNNPSTKAKIESIFRQPADHVIKSFNTFIDTVNNGPGLVNKAAEQQAMFDRYYQGDLLLGLRIGNLKLPPPVFPATPLWTYVFRSERTGDGRIPLSKS